MIFQFSHTILTTVSAMQNGIILSRDSIKPKQWLHLLTTQIKNLEVGIYREDGLCVTDATPRLIEKLSFQGNWPWYH